MGKRTALALPEVMFYASMYFDSITIVRPARLTETTVTLGGKVHQLRDENGFSAFFMTWDEAYAFVLNMRLAHAQRHAGTLASFDSATQTEQELHATVILLELANMEVRKWLEYGQRIRREQASHAD